MLNKLTSAPVFCILLLGTFAMTEENNLEMTVISTNQDDELQPADLWIEII